MLPRSFLYLSLTGGHGPTPLTIRFVDGATDRVLHGQDLPPVPFASPLDVKEIALEVPGLTFPAPGLYLWQVVHGGEVVYERRLVANRIGG